MTGNNLKIIIQIRGHDILRINLITDNAKSTRLCFSKDDSKCLLDRIKDMTRRDITHFNSRFGKDGLGLRPVDIKWKEDKL